MKQNINLMDQIYMQIMELYGTKRKDEYFTLVCKGPQLKEKSCDRYQKMIMEDQVTNCICEPYQIVEDVLPYTLSSRYRYALSQWTSSQQFQLSGQHVYESGEMLYKQLYETLNKGENILKEKKDIKDVEAYKAILNDMIQTSKCLYLQKHDKPIMFGEEELIEARRHLNDDRMLLPGKGYVYPVVCSPSNWMDQLSTSFQSIDTLPSLYDILKRLLEICEQMEEQIKKLMFYEHENTETIHQIINARSMLIKKIIKESKTEFNSTNLRNLFLISMTFDNISSISSKTMEVLLDFIKQSISKKELYKIFLCIADEKTRYVQAIEDALKLSFHEPIQKEIMDMLHNLYTLWKECKQQFYQADRKALIKKSSQAMLLPEMSSQYVDTLICSSSFSSFYEESALSYSSKQMHGLSLFFGKAIPYNIDEEAMKRVELSVGCQCMQVEIQRPWMMESVFHLSSAYLRLNKEPISYGELSITKNEKAILPSYPCRMVIGKDITISCDFHNAGLQAMETVRKCAEQGKGFLCFQEDTTGFSPYIERDKDILLLRYPKAYIMGYFMRITPKDKAKLAGGE